MIDLIRRLLRRVGIGERRWIPEPSERHRHTRVVRGRMPKGAQDAPPADAENDGSGAGDPTDSVTTET